MTGAAKRNQEKKREKRDPGLLAKADNKTLRSYEVGAMPIINHIIRRMRLPDILKKFLPDDPRAELPAYRTVLVLVRNLLSAQYEASKRWPLPTDTAKTTGPT